MPQSPEEMMDYEEMLDSLADEYPEVEKSAMALKSDLLEIMPEEEDLTLDEPVEPLDLEGEALPEPSLEEEEDDLYL